MAADNRPHSARRRGKRGRNSPSGGYWIWGQHTVLTAIRNENRKILRILASEMSSAPVQEALAAAPDRPRPERLAGETIGRDLPADAVHQGFAALVAPLHDPDQGILALPGPARVVALDQVSDPHNIGAILRTAAVFGARAVIAPRDNMPGETGVMAKAASGALDLVPFFRVTNLVRSLDSLKEDGYFVLGLDAAGADSISDHMPIDRAVLVAGAEGRGLRRLVRDHCDVLTALPVDERASQVGIDSLNVAAAVAVALHELVRPR